MRKIEANVKMVVMTIDEIQKKCKHDTANRCYMADKDEAVLNGYSIADSDKAKKRIAKCRRAIAGGWSICCPMVVHKVGGDMYITDGQGRFEAAIEANKYALVKGEALPYVEIPVLLIERESIEQMRADIKSMNTNNTNWNSMDMLHCESVIKGGEIAERYSTIRRYQDTLGLSTDYIPRIILFGDHRHSRNDVLNVKQSEHAEFMLGVFKQFYESQETRTNRKLRNKARRVEVAMSLWSIVNHIINACGHDNEELFTEVVNNAITKLCAALSRMNDDEYMRTMGSRSFYVGNTFADIIASRNRNQYIAVAINNFRAAKFGKTPVAA